MNLYLDFTEEVCAEIKQTTTSKILKKNTNAKNNELNKTY